VESSHNSWWLLPPTHGSGRGKREVGLVGLVGLVALIASLIQACLYPPVSQFSAPGKMLGDSELVVSYSKYLHM
jgi:hypothetical protein